MNSYFSPIDYCTNINPIIFAYNTGAAFGYRPGNLFGFGYFPQSNFYNFPAARSGVFSFGQNTYPIQNSFQNLLNATNPYGYRQNYNPVYKFNTRSSFGSISTQKSQYTAQSVFTLVKSPAQKQTTQPTAQNYSYNSKVKQLNTSELAANAQKYLGCSERNNAHMKFITNTECHRMDPYNEEWCADFVTHIAKETYRQQGLRAPLWFGSHDVATLKRQAIYHGMYINTTTKQDKESFISQNIKTGDIVILNQNGASHTGVVTNVNADGSFDTIEGNVGDPGGNGIGEVCKNHYYANNSTLSGFIRLT